MSCKTLFMFGMRRLSNRFCENIRFHVTCLDPNKTKDSAVIHYKERPPPFLEEIFFKKYFSVLSSRKFLEENFLKNVFLKTDAKITY